MNFPPTPFPLPQTQPVTYPALFEPNYMEALKTMMGHATVVETVRGGIQGVLVDVKPDHIVLRSIDGDTYLYIRLQEIVYVMPTI